jgi:hypothetical protein
MATIVTHFNARPKTLRLSVEKKYPQSKKADGMKIRVLAIQSARSQTPSSSHGIDDHLWIDSSHGSGW